MRKVHLSLSLGLALIVGMALAGCQKGQETKESPTIKIGLVGAQTGSDGQIGIKMLNGSKIAIDEWNAKGGVLGKKIETIILDDEGKSDKAVTMAQTLVDDGVVAVIGHFNSNCTIPASTHYSAANIIEISPGSTNPDYTDRGLPYAFRICGRDDQQGPIAANFIHDKLKLNKLAILHDKSTYGQGIAEVVKKTFEGLGGQVVMFQGIGKEERDFRANISVLKGSGAEAFFWGGMYGQGGPLYIQLREAGLNIPFVSDDGCQDESFTNTVGKSATNIYLTFGPDYRALPAAQPFLKKYQEAFHETEGSYSVYGYDAANVLLTAMEQAKSTDAAKVAAVMKSQPFDTTLGRIEFDQKGDVKGSNYVIWTVKDGNFEVLHDSP